MKLREELLKLVEQWEKQSEIEHKKDIYGDISGMYARCAEELRKVLEESNDN